MKLGFIGTGALSAAIVTGLKTLPGETTSVTLSPRNEEIAASLAARFPDVHVAADNQAVLDACDTVMLAVRPQVARDVLPTLRFRPDHHVVSLIATFSVGEIAEMVGAVQRVTKALPMPMIAIRRGPTILFPPDPVVAAFFGRLGTAIEVASESEFDALSVATATYASYFKYLETIHSWLRDHGVDDAKGRDYVASLFGALGQAPEITPDASFAHLAGDYATRGGINEQVLRELSEHGTFDRFRESLDGIHKRITAAS
ncbi:MAG TPA: pyrroline-5-carboxylate reductase [Ensifer sp.]|jgi:pyrroline-5-carboxylate reductase|uniref:pyrroline-5-carboxylate reductase n=1 Tax=Ensifer sp. TaxID=1872086 RepID=UPI002E100E44|nr:pyrroline-5-carboxylate reductase [Ensifer sp.]